MYIEFCEGGALDSIMVDLEKPLTEKQIKYIAHEMLEGLDFLHKNKVIHRDLKAGNVLLTAEGDVKLGRYWYSAVIYYLSRSMGKTYDLVKIFDFHLLAQKLSSYFLWLFSEMLWPRAAFLQRYDVINISDNIKIPS